MTSEGKTKLGEILVTRGLVRPESVAAALNRGSGRLASELFRVGAASERALAVGLAEQRGHPAVVLSESTIALSSLELVPRVFAEQHRVLPLAVDAEHITLAAAEVTQPSGGRRPIFDQVEFASGRKVISFLAVDGILGEAIRLAYDAHRGGESQLVGSVSPPAGAAQPLSIVRPPARPVELAQDALSTPSELPADLPTVVGAYVSDKPIVLVVDDEDDIRGLLRRVLSYDGYDVVEAATGREALEKLRTMRPALILLDAMLPEIHGFEICATIKASPAFQGVPVVMVSAVYKGWENARQIQEVHKADAFVEKPFDVHYLRQLVARLVGKDLPKNALSSEWRKKVAALRDEAQVAYKLDDLAGAEDAIRRWRALDPFDAASYLLLGNIRSKAQDVDGAMKAYERAVAFDGGFFPAFKNLAVVYEQLGFQQRASWAWYRAYELAPDAETRRRIEERLGAR